MAHTAAKPPLGDTWRTFYPLPEDATRGRTVTRPHGHTVENCKGKCKGVRSMFSHQRFGPTAASCGRKMDQTPDYAVLRMVTPSRLPYAEMLDAVASGYEFATR